MNHFQSVSSAIARANFNYNEYLDAAHPVIEDAEAWINSHKASTVDIIRALDAGKLYRSPTSGRLYIQLRRFN